MVVVLNYVAKMSLRMLFACPAQVKKNGSSNLLCMRVGEKNNVKMSTRCTCAPYGTLPGKMITSLIDVYRATEIRKYNHLWNDVTPEVTFIL